MVGLMLSALCACSGSKSDSSSATQSGLDTVIVNSQNVSSADVESSEESESLNDIRFKGWTSKEYLDNPYIYALRDYFNEYLAGRVNNPSLDPYKSAIKGKFVIADSNDFILGGLLLKVIFLDMPDRIFSGWVYSDVDEQSETVTGYEVRDVKIEDDKTEFTRERILELVKEHPELKLF